ncbi:MAG: hypothetical protein HKL88_00365 [Bacteroidia bacterium]|jgi:hypothetical protein|nr:hypothetical protein [Bacteroidia bacterium]
MAGTTLSFGIGKAQNSTTGGGNVVVQDLAGVTVTCLNPAGLAINAGDHVLFAVITNPNNGSQTNVILKDN